MGARSSRSRDQQRLGAVHVTDLSGDGDPDSGDCSPPPPPSDGAPGSGGAPPGSTDQPAAGGVEGPTDAPITGGVSEGPGATGGGSPTYSGPPPSNGQVYTPPAAQAPTSGVVPDYIPKGCFGGGTWCFGSIILSLNTQDGIQAGRRAAGKPIVPYSPSKERAWYLVPTSWGWGDAGGFWSLEDGSGSDQLARAYLGMSAVAGTIAGGFLLAPELAVGGTTLGAIGATPVTAGGLAAGASVSAPTLARSAATARAAAAAVSAALSRMADIAAKTEATLDNYNDPTVCMDCALLNASQAEDAGMQVRAFLLQENEVTYHVVTEVRDPATGVIRYLSGGVSYEGLEAAGGGVSTTVGVIGNNFNQMYNWVQAYRAGGPNFLMNTWPNAGNPILE
jgi:hypothetical protein